MCSPTSQRPRRQDSLHQRSHRWRHWPRGIVRGPAGSLLQTCRPTGWEMYYGERKSVTSLPARRCCLFMHEFYKDTVRKSKRMVSCTFKTFAVNGSPKDDGTIEEAFYLSLRGTRRENHATFDMLRVPDAASRHAVVISGLHHRFHHTSLINWMPEPAANRGDNARRLD